MITGTFHTEEIILETTRPDTLEGTRLDRFPPDEKTRAINAYRRAKQNPQVTRIGLYRQKAKITRWEIAVE